jgi:hypothetical protein
MLVMSPSLLMLTPRESSSSRCRVTRCTEDDFLGGAAPGGRQAPGRREGPAKPGRRKAPKAALTSRLQTRRATWLLPVAPEGGWVCGALSSIRTHLAPLALEGAHAAKEADTRGPLQEQARIQRGERGT